MRTTTLITCLAGIGLAAIGLAACQPAAPANRPVATASILACQDAAKAQGYADWEPRDVDARAAPAGAVSIRGKLVKGDQTKTFACAFDAASTLVNVTVQ